MKLQQLIDNAITVLPKTKERAKVRMTKIEDVDGHFTFFGVSESSSKATNLMKGMASEDNYTMRIDFLSAPSSARPRSRRENVKVDCTCPAYRWFFQHWNFINNACDHDSPPYKKVPGSNRPETNPDHLPGLCKHLLSFTEHLRSSGRIGL